MTSRVKRTLYYKKLQNDIIDESYKIASRYKKFPWGKIYKIKKSVLNSNTPIRVHGTLFSVKELIKRIRLIETKVKIKSKPNGYKHILRSYMSGAKKMNDSDLVGSYNTYKKALLSEVKSVMDDIQFCFDALRELNKVLKSRNIKESEDIEMSRLEEYMESKGLELKPVLEDVELSLFEAEAFDDDDFVNSDMNELDYQTTLENKDSVMEMMSEASSFAEEFYDNYFTEGITSNIHKAFGPFVKESRALRKEILRYTRKGKIDEAIKKLKEAKELADKTYKKLSDIDTRDQGFLSSIISGFAAVGSMLIAAYARESEAAIANQKAEIEGRPNSIFRRLGRILRFNYYSKLAMDARNKWERDSRANGGQLDWEQYRNLYKEQSKNIVNAYTNFCNDCIKALEKIKKDSFQKKEVKESTDIDDLKLQIYEAYNNGEINQEEKYELLNNIYESEFEDDDPALKAVAEGDATPELQVAPREKFDAVKRIIYSQYSEGTIDLAERERLVRKAMDDYLITEEKTVKDMEAKDAAAQKAKQESVKTEDKAMDAQANASEQAMQKAKQEADAKFEKI